MHRMCKRCGGALDERDCFDQEVCSDCQYEDWHEEYPDVYPEQEDDSDAS